MVLLTAELALIGWFSLRTLPVTWVYDANLRPFATIHRELTAGDPQGYRQLVVQLLLMAPLGVLLPLVGGGLRAAWLPSLLRTAGLTALIATGVEFLQSGVPGHVLDVDDVLLSLIGVMLAHIAVVPGSRAVLRNRRLRRGPTRSPGRPERPARSEQPAESAAPKTLAYEVAPVHGVH